MDFFLPEYIHIYKMDDEYVAIYNALTMDLVYVRNRLVSYEGSRLTIDGSINHVLLHKGMACNDKQSAERAIRHSIGSYDEKSSLDRIKFLYIVPTVSCNLNCTYCHIQHGKEHRKSIIMSNATLKNGLDLFQRYNGFNTDDSEIMFYGGEPFLAAKFVFNALKLIRSYSKTIRITFFTNGTLITEELADALKDCGAYVIVSIDGRESVHNSARIAKDGGGSYQQAAKGYRLLQKKGVPLGISLVAGTHNINTLAEEVSFLSEEYSPLDIGISMLHLFKDEMNPNEVDIRGLTQAMQETQVTMRKKGVYIEHLFRKIRPFIEQRVRVYDCPSCNAKLLITPWDTVGFCEAFMEDELYFYDISGFDLHTCKGRKDWAGRIPLKNRDCYSCPAISICGGGCPYDAYCENGSVCDRDTRRCVYSMEIIKWVCQDLFSLLKQQIKEQDMYVPSMQDRRLLYGNVEINKMIPLQNYSRSNEE